MSLFEMVAILFVILLPVGTLQRESIVGSRIIPLPWSLQGFCSLLSIYTVTKLFRLNYFSGNESFKEICTFAKKGYIL